jgi:hypothetical protein
MPHSVFQPVSQAAGLFVPQSLLLDARLKPMERNAWMVFRSQADSKGIATVSYESLRTALLCAPGSQRAALSTVSCAVLCLRLTTWIDQTGYRRNPRTGFSLAGSYTVRSEPLSFAEAYLDNEDYLPLLERGLKHTHVTVRNLARDILNQAMNHPDELAQLPPALREEVKRLHQQAHSSEDGSGDGGSSCNEGESDQYLSSTPPTFPKCTPEIPETVRTVQNNVCKVPTYRTPREGTPKEEALARFRRLAADQQDFLSGRLRALPVEQRRDVLAEWSIRCAAGTVRDAAAYLFGLIRKALQGTFRLWAARKDRQERPASGIQEMPRETPKPASPSGTPVAEPVDKPASREVASAYLQHMKALLQGSANTAPAIHVTKPPERRHPQAPLVRAMAQTVSPADPLRPLAAFLTPIVETGR